MAQLPALPVPLNPGDPENINDVVTNLEALRNAINGISADQINNGAVGLTELTANIVNSLVPVGTIIDWFPPAAATAPWDAFLPSGYVVCDGRAWSTVTNDLGYSTGNVPNLIGKTTYGATAATARDTAAALDTTTGVFTNAGIGGAVGAETTVRAHEHTVPSHQHNMQHFHGVADHQHGLTGKTFGFASGSTYINIAYNAPTNNASSYTGPSLTTGTFLQQDLTPPNTAFSTTQMTGAAHADNRSPGIAVLKIMKVRSAA
jgi:hypothetical protein